MRLSILSLFLLVGCALAAKSATKALTESLGQEVIEIGAPLKELPGELEEEPSMEKEDEDARSSPAVKVPLKKAAAPVTVGRRKIKDIDRIDAVNQEDDEQRVEKELSDIYRDNDYRADSNELKTSEEDSLRQGKKTDFVFAPKDINNPKMVERFRTSPDYIDCKKKKLVPNLNNPKEVERFRTSVDGIACDKKTKLKLMISMMIIPNSRFELYPNDVNDPKQVELFRTSRDIVHTSVYYASTDRPGAASSSQVSLAVLGICALGVYYS